MQAISRVSGLSGFDMVMALSNALDLVAPSVVGHHKRVAYIATRLAAAHGLSHERQALVGLAGALHDVGVLTRAQVLTLSNPEMAGDEDDGHGDFGARLLAGFEPTAPLAPLIRYHHVSWLRDHPGSGPAPIEAHILHLADRVDIQIRPQHEILGQVPGIVQRIVERSGTSFGPELVEAFRELAEQEGFWLDTVTPGLDAQLVSLLGGSSLDYALTFENLLGIARLFSQVIDFRSRFTAAHSAGVAIVAEALARGVGFSPEACDLMRLAGYLHDLGKLAVPSEILDKPGKLTQDEYWVVRKHSYYTDKVLRSLGGFDTIRVWAASHHETLDGQGYPYRIGAPGLDLGARVMAVADIFTAISEDRPYRARMPESMVVETFKGLAARGKLDPEVVKVLLANHESLHERLHTVEQAVVEGYYSVTSTAD